MQLQQQANLMLPPPPPPPPPPLQQHQQLPSYKDYIEQFDLNKTDLEMETFQTPIFNDSKTENSTIILSNSI